MRVFIATPLRSYTGEAWVEAHGATLGAVLEDLDGRFPGLRFRVVDEQDRLRRHMRLFVNGIESRDLGLAVAPGDQVHVLQALSGG